MCLLSPCLCRQHALSDKAIHKKLDITEMCESECVITAFQHAYFYTESFDEAKEKLRLKKFYEHEF